MTAVRKQRSSYSAGLATRELILATATEMLSEYGYYGVTLRDLARRVGISHPAVIYHFPNKDAMVEAAIMRFEEKIGFVNVGRDEETGRIVPLSLKQDTYIDYTVQMMRLAAMEDVSQLLSFSSIIEYEPVGEEHPMFAYSQARRQLFKDFVAKEAMRLKDDGIWNFVVESTFVADTLFTLWAGTIYQARLAKVLGSDVNPIVNFLATAVVILKISPGELLDFSSRVPEDLASVYVRIMRHVGSFLE